MSEKDYMDNEAVIHLYGQGAWHEDAEIVCNLKGLQALKDACEDALEHYIFPAHSPTATIEVFAVDGEGYTLRVTTESAEVINKRRLPYTDEMFKSMYRPEDGK